MNGGMEEAKTNLSPQTQAAAEELKAGAAWRAFSSLRARLRQPHTQAFADTVREFNQDKDRLQAP